MSIRDYLSIILVVGVVYYVWHCQHIEANHQIFVAGVRAEGEKALKEAKEQAAKDRKAKEDADGDLKKARSALATERADNKRLRAERARAGFLPAAEAGAKHPDRAAIDRAKFERTMEYLDAEGAGIAEGGDGYRVGLDVAKRWAQEKK